MWKNVVDPERPHTTIWLMRLACWIPEATHTNTHTHTHTHTLRICNTRTFAFPRQHWLCDRVTLLCNTCIACLVSYVTRVAEVYPENRGIRFLRDAVSNPGTP